MLYYNLAITGQEIPSPKKKHTLLGFTTTLPKLVKGSLGPKQAWMPPDFFTNILMNFPISILRIYQNPTITSQGIPRPLGIFPRPPHSVEKPSENPKLNPMKEPHHTWLSGNGKERIEPMSHLENLCQ